MNPVTLTSPPEEESPTPEETTWRFSRLVAAPHRLGFFSAATLMACAGLWWALVLVTRSLGIPLPWEVPPPVAHGLIMSLGFMPLFIVGFLFTAGPRWLGHPGLPARQLMAPVALMVSGWAVALIGFHASTLCAAFGLGAVTVGWSRLVFLFATILRQSQAADRRHASLITLSAALGAVALGWAAAALGLDHPSGARAATQLALWGFLAPTFVIVAHRMVPFFTVSVLPVLKPWRPYWLLGVLLTALGAHGGMAIAETLSSSPLPTAFHWALAVLEAPVGGLALWLAWRWGLRASFQIRLLAMLHASLPWLGITFFLSAIAQGVAALGGPGQALGLAPLHALTMGFMGTLMIAMITRVTTGHSGRPLAADNLAWGLYWCVQVATLFRVVAALSLPLQTPLTLVAVGGWAVATTLWAGRYGTWLGKPRADHQPG